MQEKRALLLLRNLRKLRGEYLGQLSGHVQDVTAAVATAVQLGLQQLRQQPGAASYSPGLLCVPHDTRAKFLSTMERAHLLFSSTDDSVESVADLIFLAQVRCLLCQSFVYNHESFPGIRN